MTVPIPDDFLIGRRVYLKSGSPQMVIRGTGEAAEDSGKKIGLVHCVWIVDGEVRSGNFPWQCLTFRFPSQTPPEPEVPSCPK